MIRNFATLLWQAFVVALAVWSIGALLGLVKLGYCMVSGC